VPGGGVEKGLSNQQNALKETWEETGLHVEITGHLGDFKDSNNGKMGRLYAGKRIGGSPVGC
jgi:8-oxo-dGTP pyrophosphatase MutT (NUDIX family)